MALTFGTLEILKESMVEKSFDFKKCQCISIPERIINKGPKVKSWDHLNKQNKVIALTEYIDKLFRDPMKFPNNSNLTTNYSQPALIYKVSTMVKTNKFNSSDTVIYNGSVEEILLKI